VVVEMEAVHFLFLVHDDDLFVHVHDDPLRPRTQNLQRRDARLFYLLNSWRHRVPLPYGL